MEKEKVTDLSRDEQLAPVALVGQLALADRHATAEEAVAVDTLAGELGGDLYRDLSREADERFRDEGALKAFLGGISSLDARELIFGLVLGEAEKGSVAPAEDSWLTWLADEWKIALGPVADEDLGGE